MKKLFQILFVEPTTNVLLQLFRYGFVGGVAFLADYGTLALLTEIQNVHYLISAAIAFVIGLIINYVLSVSWVFRKEHTHEPFVEFCIFAVIGMVGLAFNEGIMYVCTDLLTCHYLLSKLISTAIVFFWNFFARKLILFRREDECN